MDHTEDMMDQEVSGALPLRGRSAAPDGVEPAAQSQAEPAAANAGNRCTFCYGDSRGECIRAGTCIFRRPPA